MKILIVDDEDLARERIHKLLRKFDPSFEIKQASEGKSALELLEKFNPDLIYLDISLQQMTGFEILEKKKTHNSPIVIFISAHENYALKAYDKEASDYILKPFEEERFYKSLKKVLLHHKYQTQASFEERIKNVFELDKNQNNHSKNLPVKLGNKTIFIKSKDIMYIVADRYYAEIHTEKNKHIIRQSLSGLMDMLDSNKFSRIHRSTIINIEFIQEIIHSDYSEIDIKMNNGNMFRVSRSYKKELLSQLGI